MSAEPFTPAPLSHRVEVFKNQSLTQPIALCLRRADERGITIQALTRKEAQQIAAQLLTLARQERRRAKR